MIIASEIPKHKPATEGGKAMKAIAYRDIRDPGT
jgi:hypothetical protein